MPDIDTTRTSIGDDTTPPTPATLDTFDLDAFREGHLTPVYFGSALKEFGVDSLIEALATHAPPPRPQPAPSPSG